MNAKHSVPPINKIKVVTVSSTEQARRIDEATAHRA